MAMIGRVLLFSTLFACALSGSAGHARPPAAPVAKASVRNGTLVRLGGNDLLIWNRDGQAQVLRGGTRWQPETQLPLATVRQVRAQGSHVLAVGFDAEREPVALQLTAALAPEAQWRLPQEWFEIGEGSSTPWLLSEKGSLALSPNGALGARAPLPAPSGAKSSSGTLYGYRSGSSVVACQGEDKTLAHAASAWCASEGDAAWQLEGQFRDPLVCGAYLVLRTQQAQKTEIAVHALASGAVVAKTLVAGRPQLACSEDRELVIGTTAIEAKALPSLEPTWKVKAKGPVAAMVVLDDWVAYQKSGSDQIQLVARKVGAK
jgi:hypothetical protein